MDRGYKIEPSTQIPNWKYLHRLSESVNQTLVDKNNQSKNPQV